MNFYLFRILFTVCSCAFLLKDVSATSRNEALLNSEQFKHFESVSFNTMEEFKNFLTAKFQQKDSLSKAKKHMAAIEEYSKQSFKNPGNVFFLEKIQTEAEAIIKLLDQNCLQHTKLLATALEKAIFNYFHIKKFTDPKKLQKKLGTNLKKQKDYLNSLRYIDEFVRNQYTPKNEESSEINQMFQRAKLFYSALTEEINEDQLIIQIAELEPEVILATMKRDLFKYAGFLEGKSTITKENALDALIKVEEKLASFPEEASLLDIYASHQDKNKNQFKIDMECFISVLIKSQHFDKALERAKIFVELSRNDPESLEKANELLAQIEKSMAPPLSAEEMQAKKEQERARRRKELEEIVRKHQEAKAKEALKAQKEEEKRLENIQNAQDRQKSKNPSTSDGHSFFLEAKKLTLDEEKKLKSERHAAAKQSRLEKNPDNASDTPSDSEVSQPKNNEETQKTLEKEKRLQDPRSLTELWQELNPSENMPKHIQETEKLIANQKSEFSYDQILKFFSFFEEKKRTKGSHTIIQFPNAKDTNGENVGAGSLTLPPSWNGETPEYLKSQILEIYKNLRYVMLLKLGNIKNPHS